jgi:hypothetical protein
MVGARTVAALKARLEYFTGPQYVGISQQILASTPGAVRCPVCWDAVRGLATNPRDPTCLGTGWIIPATPTAAAQGGFTTPVAFPDAFVSPGETKTQWIDGGVQEWTQDTLYWLQQPITPKKGDIVLVVTPTLLATRRYVLEDVQQPRTLGGATLMNTAVLSYREPEDVSYMIPAPDALGIPAGQWG